MSGAGDVESIVQTVGRALLVLIVLSIVLGAAFGAGVDILDEPKTATVNTEGETGSFVHVGHDMRYSYGIDAAATLGNALALDGDDYVESSAPSNLTQGSWTVCAVAELGTDANENATYTIAAYDNESILVGYDAGQYAAYYDDGSADGKATIDAPTPPDRTAVCGRWDDSADELHVTRDDAVSAAASLSSSTTSRNVSWDWIGTLDEVRAFNSSVGDATIADYADDPIQPLPGTDRAVRFLFDEGEGSTTHGYFGGVDATITGASWTDGVDGPAIDAGDDYDFERNPLRIRLVTGGYMDGAPTVFVISGEDTWYALLTTFGEFGTTAFVLVGLGLIAIAGAYVMRVFGRVGDGGGR